MRLTKINNETDTGILSIPKVELEKILLSFDDGVTIENDIVVTKDEILCCDKECRHWIEFSEDGNCALETIRKNPEGLSYKEIGKRLEISADKAEKTLGVALRKIFHGLQK
jgi:hypothetical protein